VILTRENIQNNPPATAGGSDKRGAYQFGKTIMGRQITELRCASRNAVQPINGTRKTVGNITIDGTSLSDAQIRMNTRGGANEFHGGCEQHGTEPGV
jgi:hypothetical protein